jgi:hypothetical protein
MLLRIRTPAPGEVCFVSTLADRQQFDLAERIAAMVAGVLPEGAYAVEVNLEVKVHVARPSHYRKGQTVALKTAEDPEGWAPDGCTCHPNIRMDDCPVHGRETDQ